MKFSSQQKGSRSWNKTLIDLIDQAQALGLPEVDVQHALEFVDVGEWSLAFEIVVEQRYEYEIPIDQEFYKLVEMVSKQFQAADKTYSSLQELIS